MSGTRRSNFTVNKRRKGLMAVVMPWMKRFGVVLFIASAGFGLATWLWVGGAMKKAENWAGERVAEAGAEAGFKVKNILVEGRVYTDPDILRAALGVEQGDPLLAFDPVKAKAQIKAINWVRDVRVERRMPDTLYVGLVERKPMVLWQKKGALELLDEEGKSITSENLGRFRELLIVMGEGAPSHATDLVNNLRAEPGVMRHLKAAKWIDGRRWDVLFQQGITAKLPEGETGLALRRLAAAVEEDDLLGRSIVSVDLREEGRMIVQTVPGEAQEYKASAKGGRSI